MTPEQALQHEWILEVKQKTKDGKMASMSRKHRHQHHQDNSANEIKGNSLIQKVENSPQDQQGNILICLPFLRTGLYTHQAN